MNQPSEFTLKLPAQAIQAILDVFNDAPMPQRVSRPITDMIAKQVNEQINPPPQASANPPEVPPAPATDEPADATTNSGE